MFIVENVPLVENDLFLHVFIPGFVNELTMLTDDAFANSVLLDYEDQDKAIFKFYQDDLAVSTLSFTFYFDLTNVNTLTPYSQIYGLYLWLV